MLPHGRHVLTLRGHRHSDSTRSRYTDHVVGRRTLDVIQPGQLGSSRSADRQCSGSGRRDWQLLDSLQLEAAGRTAGRVQLHIGFSIDVLHVVFSSYVVFSGMMATRECQ